MDLQKLDLVMLISKNMLPGMIQMLEEKFFYKYQSLTKEKDSDTIYTIENLTNNQLFFEHPNKFNDPFDSRVYCFYLGTEEQFINLYESIKNYDRASALKVINEYIEKGIYEKRGDLIYTDFKKIYDGDDKKQFHRDVNDAIYPKVCCFSDTCKNILMWSHYADSHKGICLRFRAVTDWRNEVEDKYYLELDYSNPSEALQLLICELEECCKSKYHNTVIPARNIFYEARFLQVEYNNYIPDSLNMFDDRRNIKLDL